MLLIIGAEDNAAAAKIESCKNCRRVRFVMITSPKKLKALPNITIMDDFVFPIFNFPATPPGLRMY